MPHRQPTTAGLAPEEAFLAIGEPHYVWFTPDDPMLPLLQSRAPPLSLEAIDDDVVAIRGDRFLRLFCTCFIVHPDQHPLAAQATSWRPESVCRAFMALVEAGLPDVQCPTLWDFLSMCEDTLLKVLRQGGNPDLVLGISDAYFHQAEVDGAPIVQGPAWLSFSIGQLCDESGIPIGYAAYYGFSVT